MSDIQKIYNNTRTLKLDDKHRYWLDDESISLSSTKVTGKLDKSGALMGWVAKLMAVYLNDKITQKIEITPEVIEEAKKRYRDAKTEAADIGTSIHDWIEKWIKNKSVSMPSEDIRVINGITAFLKWQTKQKMIFNKKDSERLVYSKKYKYAGKLDAIATIKRKKVIIDFKSSGGIYNEYRYQLASYWHAYEEEFGKTFDHGMIVRFDKETGNFDENVNILRITRDEYIKDFSAFEGLLKVARREEELLCIR